MSMKKSIFSWHLLTPYTSIIWGTNHFIKRFQGPHWFIFSATSTNFQKTIQWWLWWLLQNQNHVVWILEPLTSKWTQAKVCMERWEPSSRLQDMMKSSQYPVHVLYSLNVNVQIYSTHKYEIIILCIFDIMRLKIKNLLALRLHYYPQNHCCYQ